METLLGSIERLELYEIIRFPEKDNYLKGRNLTERAKRESVKEGKQKGECGKERRCQDTYEQK